MTTTAAALTSAPTAAIRPVRSDTGGNNAPREGDDPFPDLLADLDSEVTSGLRPEERASDKSSAAVRSPNEKAVAALPGELLQLAGKATSQAVAPADVMVGSTDGTQRVDPDPATFLLQAFDAEVGTEEGVSLVPKEPSEPTKLDAPNPALAMLTALGTGPQVSVEPPLDAAPPQDRFIAPMPQNGVSLPGQATGLEQAAEKINWAVVRKETHFAPLPPEQVKDSIGGPLVAAERIAELVSRTSGEAATQAAAATVVPRRETSVSLNLPAARERVAAASFLPFEQTSVAVQPSPATSDQLPDIRPITEATATLARAGHAVEIVEVPETAPTSTPVQQVFHRLMSELQGQQSGAAAPAAPAAGPNVLWQPAAGQPLKSIDIALEPENLGKVTIRISVRDDVIRLQLDVAERPAMGLLEQDKDVLTSLMKSAGYQVDSLAVRHIDPERGNLMLQQVTDPTASPRDTGMPNLPGDTSSAGGRSGQGHRSFDQQPGGQQNQPPRTFERAGAPIAPGRGSGSGIYI